MGDEAEESMRNILLLFLLSNAAFADRRPWEFRGQFSHVNSSGSTCDLVFAQKEYTGSFFLTGSGGTTAVLHLRSIGTAGFLHNLTQVGLYGSISDFRVEKKFTIENNVYETIASGNAEKEFLIFTQNVLVKDAVTGQILCKATGEYSGFPSKEF